MAAKADMGRFVKPGSVVCIYLSHLLNNPMK